MFKYIYITRASLRFNRETKYPTLTHGETSPLFKHTNFLFFCFTASEDNSNYPMQSTLKSVYSTHNVTSPTI